MLGWIIQRHLLHPCLHLAHSTLSPCSWSDVLLLNSGPVSAIGRMPLRLGQACAPLLLLLALFLHSHRPGSLASLTFAISATILLVLAHHGCAITVSSQINGLSSAAWGFFRQPEMGLQGGRLVVLSLHPCS